VETRPGRRSNSERPLTCLRQHDPKELASLEPRWLPDRPGPLVALHAIRTGHGTAFADRWPEPRAILASAGGNFSLSGDPAALSPTDLEGRVEGFADAPREFEPLLREAFPGLQAWDRVIHELRVEPPAVPVRGAARPATTGTSGPAHGHELGLEDLGRTCGPGRARRARLRGRRAASRRPLFVGDRYVDIGVATGAARGPRAQPVRGGARARPPRRGLRRADDVPGQTPACARRKLGFERGAPTCST
jgi:hypothetical protein